MKRLVYFSPVPWTSFAQRPHRFVEWFHSRTNGDVMWVEPYPTRFPDISDLRRVMSEPRKSESQNTFQPPWLRILHPRAFPIEPLPGAGVVNKLLWRQLSNIVADFVAKGPCMVGVGKPSELALQVLTRHASTPSFYDAMDDFPAFYHGLSRVAMAQREGAIAKRVGHILVSSSALADRFAVHQEKVLMALNACTVDTLPALDAPKMARKRLSVGYVGTVADWFDWNLIIKLAKENPSIDICLVGPVFTTAPGPLPMNIEMLPACSHERAITLMQSFSVGLIPFKRNSLTDSVDPIKYYEYRALGLPVLSTKFGEMARRSEEDGVYLVNNHDNLNELIEAAVSYTPDIKKIRRFRELNSWEARFDGSGLLSKAAEEIPLRALI